MCIYLQNEDISELIDIDSVITVLRDLYKELGDGIAVGTPRTDLHHPSGDSATNKTISPVDANAGSAHYLKTMSGGYVAGDLVALRISSDIVHFHQIGGLLRRDKVPLLPGRWFGMIICFSMSTGLPVLIMQDGIIQRMRVGATSAIADDFMARKNIQDVCVIGSGDQARSHLVALTRVRDFHAAKVWSPNADHRTRFCEKMETEIERPVRPCASIEEAASNADLIITATNSRESFLQPTLMSPGMHISALQRDELTLGSYRKSDRTVIHSHLMEVNASSAMLNMWKGTVLRDHPESLPINWTELPTLGDLASRKVIGRSANTEITTFINNIGIGAQFAAVGSIILKRAMENGAGKRLDMEQILEPMHP